MIVGVTVQPDGSIIARPPVRTKIAIGVGPSGQRNYPERLDHFIFLRRAEQKSEWECDEKLFKKYAPQCKHDLSESCRNCCRQLPITFLSDDVDELLPHELAWWRKTGRVCWGDGTKATRRTEEKPEGTPWSPCGPTCPDLQRGACSVSADLYFVLADDPQLGSVCRLHTSSARSLQNLHFTLNQIVSLTGRLAGYTMLLCVDMMATNYIGDDRKPHGTVVPILSLRSSIPKLIEDAVKTGDLFKQAARALGARRIVIEEEDEGDKAPEIASEFPGRALPEASTTKPTGDAVIDAMPQAAPPPAKAPAAAPKDKPKSPPPAKAPEVAPEPVPAAASTPADPGKGDTCVLVSGPVAGLEPYLGKFHRCTIGGQEVFIREQAVLTVLQAATKPAQRPVVAECETKLDREGKERLLAVKADFAVEKPATKELPFDFA